MFSGNTINGYWMKLMESFINTSLGAAALVTLVWLVQVTWRNSTLSFWHVFPQSLEVVAFLRTALRSFLFAMWSRVGTVLFYSDMYAHQVWWFQPLWKLQYAVFRLSCNYFIKGHATGRMDTILLFPPNLIHTFFLKLWHDDVENWYYRVRHLL